MESEMETDAEFKTVRDKARSEFSREEVLKKIPALEAVIEERELELGKLIFFSSIELSGGRRVYFGQYENMYEVVFRNPNNPEENQERPLFLSREGMSALVNLYSVFGDEDKDMEAFNIHSPVKDDSELDKLSNRDVQSENIEEDN
jgi:hypothetical protein